MKYTFSEIYIARWLFLLLLFSICPLCFSTTKAGEKMTDVIKQFLVFHFIFSTGFWVLSLHYIFSGCSRTSKMHPTLMLHPYVSVYLVLLSSQYCIHTCFPSPASAFFHFIPPDSVQLCNVLTAQFHLLCSHHLCNYHHIFYSYGHYKPHPAVFCFVFNDQFSFK